MIGSALLALAAQTQFTVTNAVYNGPVKRPANARLAWRDEFNGRTLNPGKWKNDTAFNKKGWFNKEKQYYSAGQNLRVAGGRMVMEARHETPSAAPDWGGQNYTSARIFSTGPGWTYGFYEARAKLPCARGTWPAIWMLPTTMKKWPDDGEIDIMEQVGAEPNMIYATLHTGRYNHTLGTQRGAHRALPTSCSAFHRYQLDWQQDSITIGVDDEALLRVTKSATDGKPEWPFDHPFQMILNVAVGGSWAGAKGIDDGAMPQRMEIDYVRVWQSPQRSRTNEPDGAAKGAKGGR